MTMLNEDELYHFGVKGMKWGVRKTVQTVKEANKRNQDFNKNDRYILSNIGKGSFYAKRRNHLEKNFLIKNGKGLYPSMKKRSQNTTPSLSNIWTLPVKEKRKRSE